MNAKTVIPLMLVLVTSGNSGCKKYVQLELPPTIARHEAVFSGAETATAAVLGLYNTAIATNLSLLNGGATLYPALSSDELENTVPNDELDGFKFNSISPAGTLGIQNRLWARVYTIVYHANAVIEGLEGATGLTAEVQKQLMGEARTIRALCYFYAVNLFGDLPLVTSTDFRENETKERTATPEVWDQIRKDLEEAVSVLPAAYVGNNRGRINRWAAQALLSRIYLYQQQWQNAEESASAVIGSGAYALADNPALVFNSTSPETILQWVRETSNTADGASFIPSSATARPPFALRQTLLAAFEAGDARKAAWTRSNTNAGVTYHYPFKYKIRSGTTPQEYLVVLRLAEQYLIRAEARAKRGNMAGASADLSAVRKRAGLSELTLSSEALLLEAIDQERRIELFAEWGHRWLDLKRRGKASQVLAPLKAPHWQDPDTLYPLPLQELQRNPKLTQNPGY